MNGPSDLQAAVRLRSIVNQTTELTPLKAVATRAIQLAEDERSATMDLAIVISSDLALTAKLLRLSNSAYYGYARRIATVREAVVLLGMRTVRSVAISTAIIDALRVPEVEGFSEDLLWAHSVTVGLVAEAIARETRTARPEDAFTAGVIHDVGKLAMLLVEPKLFADTIDLVINDGLTFGEAELLVFGVTHDAVGARLAAKWKFPEALVSAIRHHEPVEPIHRVATLDDVVAIANLACNREGLACGFDWTRDEERKATQDLPAEAVAAIERIDGGIRTLEEKARSFLLHVTAKAPRWYAGQPSFAIEDGDDAQDPAVDVA